MKSPALRRAKKAAERLERALERQAETQERRRVFHDAQAIHAIYVGIRGKRGAAQR